MIQSWIKHFLNYAGYVNQPISYLFFNTYTVYIYIEYSLEVFLDISSIFPTSILGSVPLVLKSTYPSIWRQLWFCLWGFTSGAAIIIGLNQLKYMLGIHLDKFGTSQPAEVRVKLVLKDNEGVEKTPEIVREC